MRCSTSLRKVNIPLPEREKMIACIQIVFLLNKRAEKESVLPYLGSYPEDGNDKTDPLSSESETWSLFMQRMEISGVL